MNRFGNILTTLTILCLMLSASPVAADDSPPLCELTLTIPDDSTIRFCDVDSFCYDLTVTNSGDSDSLWLNLIEGPIDYPDSLFLADFTERICFTPETQGVYRFIWRVTNQFGTVLEDTVDFSVVFNVPPVIEDQYFSQEICVVPHPRVLPVSAYDPDCDSLLYVLVSGPGTIDSYTGIIEYDAETTGVNEFVVAVFDECTSDTAVVYDSVYVNLPPTLLVDDYIFKLCEPEEICFDVIGSDPEGGPLHIHQMEGRGVFTSLTDTSGQTCFTPPNADSATYAFIYCLVDECPFEDALYEKSTQPCLVDTVMVTVIIDQPPVIVCPDAKTFFTCDIDTFCFDVDAMDPEFSAITYAILSDNATVEGKTVCVIGDKAMDFDVVIEAVDTCGHADTCSVAVSIQSNREPYVTMADDFSMNLCQPEAICFAASADDLDFDIDRLDVSFGHYDVETNRICFDADTSGTYVIYLTATDKCGASDTDSTVVTIEINQTPVVDLGDDFNVTICSPEPICFDALITDDNTQMMYVSSGDYNATEEQVCFTPDTAGTYTIVGRIIDACDIVVEDTVLIGVEFKSGPVITGLPDSSFYLCYPQSVCLPVEISDPDNDLAEVTVNLGSYAEGFACFVPYDSGTHTVIVTATDSCGNTVSDTASVTIITDQGIALECPGDTSFFLCEADTLCFPVNGIPEGAEITVGGTATWWDEEKQAICFYSDCCLENTLTVNATTKCGTYSCSFTVNVQTNSAPLVIIPQDTTIELCEPTGICLPVGIDDIDGNVVEVSVDGATYDDYRNLLCFTPDTTGTYVIAVTAFDDCGAVDSDQMTVYVEINDTPKAEFVTDQTLFRQCVLEEICMPVNITDANQNLAGVVTDLGEYNAETGTVCFVPDAFGEHCITLTATDDCGAVDTAHVCITVEQGDFVTMTCPIDMPSIVICLPDEIHVPLDISGPDYQVSTDFGEYFEGSIRFFADTTGLYTITVIATSECNADTCVIEQSVTIQDPVTVSCPGDTSLFLCGPDTLVYDLVTTGMLHTIEASFPAWIDEEQRLLYVPITAAGTQIVTVDVEGICGKDACSFEVTSVFNSAPIVSSDDTSLVQCVLSEVCLPVISSDVDDNIVEVTSTLGMIVDGQLCVVPTQFGETEIVVTATDECELAAVDTVYVNVIEGDFVDVTCAEVEPITICDGGQVCFPVDVTGSGYQVYTDYGEYAEGEVCFDADTSGVYSITVIGDAGCNSDTCVVDVSVTVMESVNMTCDVADTSMFLCDGPLELIIPISITGDDVNVTVYPMDARYEDGNVYLTVLESGVIEFEVIAENICNADTCTFNYDIEFNEAPVLVAGPDTSFVACELTEICIPFSVTDPDDNLFEVRALRGRVNDTIICYTPDAYGDHEIVVMAEDDCGVIVEDTINISIAEGSVAIIDCPGQTLQMNIDTPDTVRIPVAIEPVDAVVTVEPHGYYDMAAGELVVFVENPGMHSFSISAEAFCNTDICDVNLNIAKYFSPKVECEGAVDTAMCLIEPTTICMPVTVTGTDAQILVSPIGDYIDGNVCVTVDTTGDYEIQIIAYNEFEADTCISMLHVGAGDPPVVTLPEDMDKFLCGPEQICVTPTIASMDFGIETTLTNIGVWSEGSICFDADTAGSYMIIADVIDSCGYTDSDTMYVNATMNEAPVVNLGEDFSRLMCEPFLVCVTPDLTDVNILQVTSNIGNYDVDLNEVCFMVDTAGTYTLVVEATDACGVTGSDTLIVEVEANSAPTIAPMPDTTIYLCYPQAVCLQANYDDIDGNIADVTTSRGTLEDGQFCFVPYGEGIYELILTVTDECGLTAVDTAQVEILTDQGIDIGCPNDTSIFLCEADTLCFPITGIPDGAEVSIGGTAAWFNEETQSVCFYSDCCLQNTLTVNVTTMCGTYSCSFTVNVQTNSSPLVIIPQDTTILQCEAEEICLPIGVSDLDENLFDVTVEGAVYDGYRNLLCLTPQGAGEYVVTVTATDSCGAVDVDQMTVTILVNEAPTAEYLEAPSMYKQCEFAEICLPVEVGDADGNLADVTVSHGYFDQDNSQVCFLPDSFGVYCITLTATDTCGVTGTDEICVEVAVGDYVSIECPEGVVETDTLCEAGQVCYPLAVTGTEYVVVTDIGEWADGNLCFQADTSGIYTITVIATAMCETDTCVVNVPVEILESVAITCPGDQNIFLCGDSTLRYDFTTSSSVTTVSVNAPATIEGSQVVVPVTIEGPLTVTLIAEGKCEADTCSFTVTSDYNVPPVVIAGADTSLVECLLFEVCVPLSVSDEDDNLMELITTNGTISEDMSQLCFTPTIYGVYEIILTAIDECGASDIDTVVISFTEGKYASITCPDDDQFVALCAPETVCLVVPIEPVDAEITILPNGQYNASTGEICVWVDEGGPMEITVTAESQCASDTCQFTLQVDMGTAPEIVCPDAVDTLLCLAAPTTLSLPVSITGTDVEVTISHGGGYADGNVTLPIDAAGDFTVEIVASGTCGVDTCRTDVSVRADQLPELFLPETMTFERCPDDTNLICIDGIYATDIESEVTLTQVCGQAGFEAVRSDSGSFCFRPEAFGQHEICIEATDGCNTVTGSFFVDIMVKDDCEVCVRMSFDAGECTPVGLRKTVAINIETNDAIAGFDVLFAYDASALTFMGAGADGSAISNWEYFTYNTNNAACGTACPSGVVRLVGIADVNNGAAHPPESAYSPQGALAFLEFQIANDQNLGDQFIPISWVWYDCGDNTFSDVSGTLLYMDLRLLNSEGAMIWDEDDDINYPDSARPFGVGAADECISGTDKTQPMRCIEFINGGICIIHPDSIDDRGDVNLDGLAYTIADAVLFTNYFIDGLGAFTISVPGQIAATDVNADGITLSVSDLVYMIRVVVGDADPYAKPIPHPEALRVSTLRSDGDLVIQTEAVESIGAAHFVYDVDPSVTIGNVRLGAAAEGMDMEYAVVDGQLRVVIYDIGSASIAAGTNELVRMSLSGEGRVNLVKVDVADYLGRPYKTTISDISVPTGYVLHQNYPNPFNPTTNISFALSQPSEWSLKIFNIKGVLVRELDGSSEAGTVSVTWDGHGHGGDAVASGVYFYRLEAGTFSATKKMILLK